jgi:hypothetical protein
MSAQPDPMDKAIRQLGVYRTFRNAAREIQIACLIRAADWRPLKASWWQGKEACVIGADLKGNFLLRHCDGTVRYWDHGLQSDTVLSPSVREFVASIAE